MKFAGKVLGREPIFSGSYSRIDSWVKTKYGNYFTPGIGKEDARNAIEEIIRTESKRGVSEKRLKSLRDYIQASDYDRLIK
jgi:hypothetical protein